MFDLLALHNKAVDDPLRLILLRILGRGSFGVLELCDLVQVKQSRLSHHLKVLTQAELVAPQREGNSIFYRRALLTTEHPWASLTSELFKTLDALALSNEIQTRMQRIYQERADQSRAFFDKHAHKFKQQQDLIASYEQYGDTLEHIIATLSLPSDACALEIGPGEGSFLPVLANTFANVHAYEVSQAMYNQCQTRIKDDFKNIHLVLGDVLQANLTTQSVSFISCNMVLHHLASPQHVFELSEHVLAPTGYLLVTDLCAHDQTWARESCGDQWLGFEPSVLSGWAQQHNLHTVQSQYLALRNGFQVQFHLFSQHVIE